ncbi:MAG: Zinc finger/thioredoxin [Parcubacteria group bacterium GW2011_GWA2_43_13]|nr:MAG: Zinc finger/thioredoxin [Parcubacteria group bacterium GW2011_GWA2_43_13]MBS3120754.1 RDD family protein [Candidatus Woesearchaeota archaeon]
MDTSSISHIPTALATPGRRLLAMLLEVVILVIPIFWILSIAKFMRDYYKDSPVLVLGIGGIIYVIIVCTLQLTLMAKRGQTLGKHLLNIYVIDDNGGKKLRLGKYLWLRFILGRTLLGSIPGIGPLYALIDVLFIFRRDRKTIHDMIAQSSVIYVSGEHRRKKLIDFSPLA